MATLVDSVSKLDGRQMGLIARLLHSDVYNGNHVGAF